MQNTVTPLISIVIPVYNVEPYLRECLDSVVNQTLKEIEIICVDDGSTDGSPAILDEYAKKDSRFTVIHQPNAGPSVARNVGIANAKGKYLYFCDSDDTIDADLCRMTFISAEYYCADVLFFDIIVYDARCKLEWVKDFPRTSYAGKINKMDTECDNVKKFAWNVWTPMKLFRADMLREHRLNFPTNLSRGEDLLFHWKVMLAAHTIGILPAHLYHYRNRPHSLMQGNPGSQVYGFLLYEELKKELISHKVYDIYKDEYIAQKLADLFYNGFRQIHPKKRSEVKKQILHTMTEEEWKYLIEHAGTIDPLLRNFYRSLQGNIFAQLKVNFWWYFRHVPRKFLSRLGVGVWYTKFKHLFAKRFSKKYVEQNRELCNLIVDLQEEVLRLRNSERSPQNKQNNR